MHNLDLLDEVFDRLPIHVLLAKLLDGHFETEPLDLVHVAIAAPSDVVVLDIEFELTEIDNEVEAA